MKKMLSLVLALCLCTSLLSACGSSNTASSAQDQQTSETTSSAAPTTAPAAVSSETEASSESLSEDQTEPAQKLVQFTIDDDFTITVSMSTHPLLMSSALVDTDGTGMGWVEYLENRTGVNIEIDLYSIIDSNDKQNLMIASGDYRDIIVGSLNYPGGVDGAVEEEVLTDIFQYADYMPDYMNALYGDINNLASALSSDYYLTAFYGITDPDTKSDFGPVIRQDWLDEQGLDTPVTYDDLHDVLTVFKEKYNATMWVTSYGGVSGDFSGGYGVQEYCGGAAFPAWIQDGQFTFAAVADGFKDYLKMMNQWYSEGLIYPDFISQGDSEYPDNSIISNNEIGVWFTYASMIGTEQDVLSVDTPSCDIEPITWPVLDASKEAPETLGKTSSNSGVDGQGCFSVTTASDDVAMICAVFNEFYTDEGSEFCNWGIKDETYVVDDNGKKSYTEMITNDPYSLGTEAMMSLYFFKDGPYRYDYTKYTTSYGEKELSACDMWTTGGSSMVLSTMTSDQSTEYNNLKADVSTVYQEYTVKFITGAKDIDAEWDSFISALEDCGLDRFIELGQEGADQYTDRLSVIQSMIDEQ